MRRCEAHASRAACDPRTGYIAGPGGQCRPSDLRCIERAWINRGRVRYYPDLGICARDHEDGGTIVACPPGIGPASGSAPRGGGRPPAGANPDRGTTGGGTRQPAGVRRQPPPPPPTLDEAVATCPGLPAPRLHRNPDHEGVTGMRTWLWAAPHAAQTSTARIRGHRVTCTATPERWTWYPGDGASHSRATPGAEPPRHAAEHVYERKGDYTQRLSVRWRLETSVGTRTATRQTSRAYRVVEIRGALVK